MADYNSKYTGEQIESFLDKIEDNSIILDNTVEYASYNEPLPISSDAVRKLWDRKGYIYDTIILGGGNHEVSGNTKFYGIPKAPIVVWKSESFELKVGETKVISNGPPIRVALDYIEETGKYILNIEDPNGALSANYLYYVNSVEPIADILIPNNIVRKSDINLPFYIDEVNLQTLILEYNENEGNPSPISSGLYEKIVKAVSEKNLIFIKRDTLEKNGYILLNIRKDAFLYYSILTEEGNIIYGEISNEYIHIYNIIPIETIQNMMEDFNTDIAALYQTKQDAISDIDNIRRNASMGATAVQPASLASVATSGSYNDLSNKPTIPSAVTETTVSGWGFTKNTGTYSKPSGGIPKSDLASAVQTSLGKADTALQSYTERYKGTVTGVKINGSTKSPSSGVVDLGTVITTHQALKTINGQSIVGSGNIEISGGGESYAGNYPVVETQPSISSITLYPNQFTKVRSYTARTFILSPPSNPNIVNEYIFTFYAGSQPYNFPSDIVWANNDVIEIEPLNTYIISIIDNIATYIKVEGNIYNVIPSVGGGADD